MKKSELMAEIEGIPGDPDIEISLVTDVPEWDGDVTDTAPLDMIEFDEDLDLITLNGRVE